MTKDKIKDTLYVAIVSAIVTMLINHYEEASGKSILSLIKDKVKDKGE